jgi:hypothetical protein
MSTQPRPKFDTAEFETVLTDAGVEKEIAQAHRKGVALSQEYLVTDAELQAVIKDQNAMIRASQLELTRWFLTGVTVIVSAIVGLAVAILKLPS